MAIPSSSSLDYHFEASRNSAEAAVSVASTKKTLRSFLWSCISALANRCLKCRHDPFSKPIEGRFHVVYNLSDKRFGRADLFIINNQFWYEMVRYESSRLPSFKKQIPNISGYRVFDMISHLMNCEIVGHAESVKFIENHHTWTIKGQCMDAIGYTDTVIINLVQCQHQLYYRVLNRAEPSYGRIELESDCKQGQVENLREQLKRNIQNYSDKYVVMNRQAVRFAEACFKLITPEIILEGDTTRPYANNHWGGVEVTLLLIPEGLVWQLYDRATQIFHQHPASLDASISVGNEGVKEKNLEKYSQYLANFNIKVNKTGQGIQTVLSVFLEKISISSQLNRTIVIDKDTCAVTLVDSGESRMDPTTWGGHAKIVVEMCTKGKYHVETVHMVSKGIRRGQHHTNYRDQTRTYVISRIRVDAWLKEMDDVAEYKEYGAYSLCGGNDALVVEDEKKVRSNCITWARRQLKKLGIVIDTVPTNVLERIVRGVVVMPVQFTQSPYLKGNISIQFLFDLTLPECIKYTFPLGRQSISLERFIQTRLVDAKAWHVIADSNWQISDRGAVTNRIVTSVENIKLPIEISIQVEKRRRMLDLTEHIQGQVKIREEEMKSAIAMAEFEYINKKYWWVYVALVILLKK